MIFCGRKIIPTTLDPVPRLLRAVPGYIVLNEREIGGLISNDGDVFKEIIEICMAETRADALYGRKR
jgi:hypothetical protein